MKNRKETMEEIEPPNQKKKPKKTSELSWGKTNLQVLENIGSEYKQTERSESKNKRVYLNKKNWWDFSSKEKKTFGKYLL